MALTEYDSISLVCSAFVAIAPDCAVEVPALTESTDFRDLALDSVQVIEAIALIEDVCGCQIPDEVLGGRSLRTIGDLATLILRHAAGETEVPPGGWSADIRFAPPPARTDEEVQEFATLFRRVRDVLDGSVSEPMYDATSKMLYFMLHRDEGCDATITAQGFEVQFGWHRRPCRYIMEVAPSTVAQLLRLAEERPPVRETHVPIEARDIKGRFPWSFGPRELWIRDEEELVRIAVRARTTFVKTGTWPTPVKPRP